ncbi:TIGR04104 family putative zinc finger protein [Lentibacillus jeotgali]|uniref:TIGR04104 family putative zinc finger protein n=1 Tax=Lentibacillus jeotgali TaxID=558169 RepID=UPI00026267D7|nr:TIGR04104 family putative zinc finger protein [Lentibacillus jeotgali]
MPSCQKCHKKWSWKQTFKRSFTLGGGMTCPYCGEKQYLTARMRKRSTIIPFIIGALIMLANLFFGPSYVSIFALLALLPLVFIINPFFVELSNEEEPLW